MECHLYAGISKHITNFAEKTYIYLELGIILKYLVVALINLLLGTESNFFNE
jgi:hypothetical protein